ncbi:MAG: acetate--CoA ligase family protein [Desulfosalsimonadaceae bacterium]
MIIFLESFVVVIHIKLLKVYLLFYRKMLEGLRGQDGVSIKAFTDVLLRLSALLQAAPEISELDLNPLMGSPEAVTAVDARIKIERAN